MRRNKLYTVNKWNKNLFVGGGLTKEEQAYLDSVDLNDLDNDPYAKSLATKAGYFSDNTNISDVSGAEGGGMGGGYGMLAAIPDSPITYNGHTYRKGAWDAADPMYYLADGKESEAGNFLGDQGIAVTKMGLSTGNPWLMAAGASAKVTGDLYNTFFGSKLNKEFISDVEKNNKRINEQAVALSQATDLGSFLDTTANSPLAMNFSLGDIGEDGAWGSEAQNTYERLKAQQQNAQERWNNALAFSAENVDNTMDRKKLSNFVYANGGQLEASFLDSFGTDPIGAAVRYNRGLEQLAAQREAEEAAAAQEQQWADMQKRMLQLETQNQGLQSLIAAMPSTPTVPSMPVTTEELSVEAPKSSSYSSKAARSSGNKTWNYVEDQLRKSGKFNDIQIQGIKYNLQRESGMNPFIEGDGGAAYGLAQWHGKRQPKDKSLEGQTKHLIETLSKYDGKEHWIGEKNYQGFLNARTPEEAHYYIAKGYERPLDSIVAKVKRDSDMSLKNLNAFGGELGTNGTNFTNGLLYVDEGGSHEDNPLEGVPMGLDSEGIPNLVEEGETVYNDYVFSDRMKVPSFMYKELGLGGVMKKKGKGMSFADASKKLAQESEQRPNDPISKAGLDASLSRLAEVQETERMKQQAEEYMGLEGYACGGKMKNKFGGDNPNGQRMNSSRNKYDGVHADENSKEQEELMKAARKKMMPALGPGLSFTDVATRLAQENTDNPMGLPVEATTPQQNIVLIDPDELGTRSEYTPPTYATWMRYAPVFGSGMMAFTDALGLTNKPDYTYADKLEAAANRAGYAPNVNYKPVGTYLRYNPMDIWAEQNRLNANARATDRAIINNAAPVGTRMAGLLANAYNNQIANGELYRKALEYNDAKRQQVADFNRKTDMFNSQMGLEAAMANARYTQMARQMGLSGLAQAAAMREQIDARTGAARSANLTNFFNNLGNIGRENFALNQINWDRSRHYGADASGRSHFKRACGGKMKRK